MINETSGILQCPCCRATFRPFLYGQVFLDGWRRVRELLFARLGRRAPRTLCLICAECKEVVAYQGTDGGIHMDPRRKKA